MGDALTVKGTSVVVNAPSIGKKTKHKKDLNKSDAVKKIVKIGEQLIRSKLKNPQTTTILKVKFKKAFADKIAKTLANSPELKSDSELTLIAKKVSEA